jgi:hypothetical protein
METMRKCLVVLYLMPITLLGQKPTVQQQVWALTEVMYHDVVSPPASARFYAYSILAGYEVLTQIDREVLRFQNKLKGYNSILLAVPRSIDQELASMYAILETGKNLIPSGYLLQENQDKVLKTFEKFHPKSIIDSSVWFAKAVSKQIVQFAKTDGYFQLSTRIRYKPMSGENYWQPTPPEYMPAVEPHWNTIRTFFLDSIRQFCAVPPIKFSNEKDSPFMKLVHEVYESSKDLSGEQKLIANFWDCNPFAVQFQGHMSIGLKKISPGGHWMGITGIVCEEKKYDFSNTLLLHAIVALTLHDAFISCWAEKFRTNRVRPETAINRYIDPKWKPLLQTPPFPEYSSGHSVISTAVAEVLTQFAGDDFAFIDSTETYIGLPSRRFSSFRQAAGEARISRLYGGIHFRDAIENGGEQGRQIGVYIIQKINLLPGNKKTRQLQPK